MTGTIPDPARARRGLVVFLALIPLLVALPLTVRAHRGGPRHPRVDFACLVALVWAPALASVIARRIFREDFSDVSLGRGAAHRVRAYTLAFAVPLAVGALAYGIAWSAGLARFVLPDAAPWRDAPALLRLAGFGASNLVIGLPRWIFLALGEEIGWRGYLLPRLLQSKLPRPVLLSALVWGAWHVPSVLWGSYPAGSNRGLSALVILVTLGAFAYVLARLRLETGSLWPAVAAHAAWNSVILDSFDGATGRLAGSTLIGAGVGTIWTRETGLLVAASSLLCAAWVSRGTWEVRLRPGDAPFDLRASAR